MLSGGRRAAAERTRRWQYRDAQLKPEPCACEYPNSTIRSPSFSMVRSRDRGRTATGRPYETHRQFDLRTHGRRWPGAMHLSCQSTIHTTRSPHHQTSLSEHWLAGQRKQDTAQHSAHKPGPLQHLASAACDLLYHSTCAALCSHCTACRTPHH